MEYLTKPWWRILWQPANVLQSELVFDPYRGLLKWGGWLGIVYTLFFVSLVADDGGVRYNNFFLIVSGGYGEVGVEDVFALFLVSWPFGAVAGVCLLYLHAYVFFMIAGIFNTGSSFEKIKQIIGWSYYIQFVGIVVIVSSLLITTMVIPPPQNEELGIMIARLAVWVTLVVPLIWCWTVQWLGIRTVTNLKRDSALVAVAIPNLLVANPVMTAIIFSLIGIDP